MKIDNNKGKTIKYDPETNRYYVIKQNAQGQWRQYPIAEGNSSSLGVVIILGIIFGLLLFHFI